MLDGVHVRTLTWPLHDRDVDSWASEPVFDDYRRVLWVVILLEEVELGAIPTPVRQQVFL